MTENWENYSMEKRLLMPVKILDSKDISSVEKLLVCDEPCPSFRTDEGALFEQKGAYILLDFGKELCGSVRLITRSVYSMNAQFRITFGESVSEACSVIGEKNATNDHSPRDITVNIANLSDLTFGNTGFRFVRIELLDDTKALIDNIYAVSQLPVFKKEAVIKTSDKKLNKIINTAAYTLKLNFQNGYIWDGIKRDRLVWCGDLHQEIVTSLYLFGDNKNITNSLDFLKGITDSEHWINTIPTYSAWWVINLCDYCNYTGNSRYFEANKGYASAILDKINSSIDEEGNITFGAEAAMPFFLDWPTVETDDAVIGTAALFCIAANKYSECEENPVCGEITAKLKKYIAADSKSKQTRAFQILAGRDFQGENEFLESNGAAGFSTFMTYYILKADTKAQGKNSLPILKQYFGGMLSRGATTFWEDFDIEWLKGSSRIDELPKRGQKDLHGDYGNYCYKGLRHSLCHGWSSGVLSFVIEDIFGINISDGGRKVKISPDESCPNYNVKLPLNRGWLRVKYKKNGELEIKAPDGTEIIK